MMTNINIRTQYLKGLSARRLESKIFNERIKMLIRKIEKKNDEQEFDHAGKRMARVEMWEEVP
jgi:hypothetical protein